MIVIDTNVISEMMREHPDPAVRAWTAAAGQLHTTAITLAEVEYGIARLATGRRRAQLAAMATEVFADFQNVILPFDAESAHCYATIVAKCEASGRPVTTADAQIAAICTARRASLATRNTRDFAPTGIRVVNPWQVTPQ